MEIEAGLSATLDIVARGKARERYRLEGSFSLRFGKSPNFAPRPDGI
jgi:hypothetical protein